jgi:hypothetical protein
VCSNVRKSRANSSPMSRISGPPPQIAVRRLGLRSRSRREGCHPARPAPRGRSRSTPERCRSCGPSGASRRQPAACEGTHASAVGTYRGVAPGRQGGPPTPWPRRPPRSNAGLPAYVHNHRISHQVLDASAEGRAELIASGPIKEDTMDRVWLITEANSCFGRAITEAAVAAGDVAVSPPDADNSWLSRHVLDLWCACGQR